MEPEFNYLLDESGFAEYVDDLESRYFRPRRAIIHLNTPTQYPCAVTSFIEWNEEHYLYSVHHRFFYKENAITLLSKGV